MSYDIFIFKEEVIRTFLKDVIFEEEVKILLNKVIQNNYDNYSSLLYTIITSDLISYYKTIEDTYELTEKEKTKIYSKFSYLPNDYLKCSYIHVDIYDLLYYRPYHRYDIYSIFTSFFYTMIEDVVLKLKNEHEVNSELLDSLTELIYTLFDILESVIINHSCRRDITNLSFKIVLYKNNLSLIFAE